MGEEAARTPSVVGGYAGGTMIEHRPFVCAGHAEFDVRLAEVVAHARGGRWVQLDGVWSELADDLAGHLDYEEREMFDDYEHESASHAIVVARLRDDHAALREHLAMVGRAIAARAFRDDLVEHFVDRLREHAQREDATLYAWLEQRRGRPRGLSQAP